LHLTEKKFATIFSWICVKGRKNQLQNFQEIAPHEEKNATLEEENSYNSCMDLH
jgi:hypothetical protein